MLKDKTLVIIFGPTGVGKTDLSIEIAKHFNSEILSCDSRQIYKELNIGVAKPDDSQLKEIKHHFISSVSIKEHYSIYQFEEDSIKVLDEYFKHKDIAIMCGGSGLYIDAVCHGVDEMPDHDEEIRNKVTEFYNINGIEALRFELKRIDPIYYSQVDLKNPNRIMRAIEMFYLTGKPFSDFRNNVKAERNFKIIKIGINLDREILYNRINSRVDKMMQNGLFLEVQDLHKEKNLVALKTIGYRELFQVIDNEISLDEATELIKRNTWHYARRQLTWYRRYKDAMWFSPEQITDTIKYIKEEINVNK